MFCKMGFLREGLGLRVYGLGFLNGVLKGGVPRGAGNPRFPNTSHYSLRLPELP